VHAARSVRQGGRIATATVAVIGATWATAAASASAGVVALWHMDERSGTSMLDSAGRHTGTLHSVSLGLPGFLGTAYGFGSGYVSVPAASDLNPGGNTLTITIHAKTTQAPSSPDWDLIRKGLYTTSGGEFKMEYQPSGQASCGFKGSSGYAEMTAGPRINDGRWHTVQCVKTSSAIQVVVDGQRTSKAANIGSIGNSESVIIGARPGSEYFRGSLDEASIQVG
jgi:Concanavalin A-like lectin/glucanases superfamily